MIWVTVATIPHESQRYPTAGDWQVGGPGTPDKVLVSDMGNVDYEVLVAVHEFVEMILCKKAGVTDEEVTDFDEGFERARQPDDDSQPGDHPLAPYRVQHQLATKVERLLAEELGVDWDRYEARIAELFHHG